MDNRDSALTYQKFGIFDVFVIFICIILCAVTIYPFLYVLAYSLSNSVAAMTHRITVFPVQPTLENYYQIFRNNTIVTAYLVTIARTFFGIIYQLSITLLAAYAMAKGGDYPGKRAIFIFLVIPMFIGGGLIPNYVLITRLGLLDNFLVFILPSGFSIFYCLIIRTYFYTIPDSLAESSRLDGAGELTIFMRIYLPLSRPILATMAMFIGVGHWNAWFDAVLYISRQSLYPLATMLYRLMQSFSISNLQLMSSYSSRERMITAESIKMATVMASTLPIMCIYPFFQKHFIKGVMIGAIKE